MLAENGILRTVVIETAFPLTFMGYISAGYVHDTGPKVAVKLQIRRSKSLVVRSQKGKENNIPANKQVVTHDDSFGRRTVAFNDPCS